MVTLVMCMQLQSCKAYDSLLISKYIDLTYEVAIVRQLAPLVVT